jgi:hypothetical protein
MKTSLSLIIIAVLFSLMYCKDDEFDKNASLTFVRTELGGCNLKSKSPSQSSDNYEHNDSVNISGKNDSTYVFVGLNYICCAPFVTGCRMQNDTILMSVSDTCSYPYLTCYCHCDCYYTFNFMFSQSGRNNYKYKIILNSPLENKTRTLQEGIIKIR